MGKGIELRRKPPGTWLRRKLFLKGVRAIIAASATLGALITTTVIHLLGIEVAFVFWAVVVWMIGFAIWFSFVEEPSAKRLEKGLDGDLSTGDVIELALTAQNCAVAHSVMFPGDKVGDIDHLVVTPVRLWVIETKFKRVHPKKFPEVVRRIQSNVNKVREWARESEVQGCLVLATGRVGRRNYEHGKVVVHSPKTLMAALKDDACRERKLDPKIVDNVWELARKKEL